MELKRRPFPAAVRYVLGLPEYADDTDVLAELALVKYAAKQWEEYLRPPMRGVAIGYPETGGITIKHFPDDAR